MASAPVKAKAKAPVKAKTLAVRKILLIDFIPLPEQGITQQRMDELLNLHLKTLSTVLTMADLSALVDDINALYQQAGYTFTRAVIEAQEITDQTIKLRIVSGNLAVIDVRNNQLYSVSQIEQVFSASLNKIIYKPDIEQQLMLLNDYPGLQSFAYFSRGRKLGQSNLNIKVEKENAFHAAIQLDNYGSESTGENRLTGQMSWNNLAGLADQLSVALMMSDQIEDNLYGSVLYKLALASPRWWLWASASNNQFDVGGEFSSLKIEGDVGFYTLGLDYKLYRSNNFNQIFGVSLDHKRSITDSAIFGGDFFNEERLSSINMKSVTNQVLPLWRLSHEAVADLTLGQYESEVISGLSTSYQLARFQYTVSILAADASSWFYSDVSLQLKGQFSGGKQLPVLERFSATGPYAVRAMVPSFYSADEAYYASVNWRWYKPDWLGNNAFSKHLRPSLFIDYVSGRQYLLEHELNTLSITAVGILLSMQWQSLSISLSAAKTLSIAISGALDPAMQEPQTHLYLRAAYFID